MSGWVPDARGALLAWFDENRRDLPWRTRSGESPDPYRVWLSEVMLQQTRVETVRPYFERWIEQFPDLESLAAADQDTVLKAWEGLGYYSRARNLHRAVREVVARYGSVIPNEPDAFRALPGVGRYTAGAVMSIAFDRQEPVVDGNVRRVFARLLDEAEPSEGTLWNLASEFAAGDRPGDLNQGLMELGALVCTPRSPDCSGCPIALFCAALERGTQEMRPRPRKMRAVKIERHGVAVVQSGGSLLLVQRPEKGRLGGMWEFPGAQVVGDEQVRGAAVRAAKASAGVDVVVHKELGAVRHVFTHVTVDYHAFLCAPAATPPGALPRTLWVERGRIGDLALPAAQHRILELYDDSPELISSSPL